MFNITDTLTACTDDRQVIKQMERQGLGKKAQAMKASAQDEAIFTQNGQAFIYMADKQDSGFISLSTTKQEEILQLLIIVESLMNGALTRSTIH